MNNLNKRQFGNFPTRIAFDKKISNYLNINLFIKKEFEADIFGSGNKVRKINLYAEYLKKQEITDIIADGDMQSNYCMALSNYFVPKGYIVHLILTGEKLKILKGNRLQMHLSGSRIYEIGKWDLNKIEKKKNQIKARCEKNGKKVVLIGTDITKNLTLKASIELGKEIYQQERKLKIKFDYIFVAAGTGETHAGIEIYKQLNDLKWNVVGVSIANRIDFFNTYHKEIFDLYKGKIDASKFTINTSFVGRGYGKYSQKDIDDILRIRKDYGLILDSTYTYKCFKAIKRIFIGNKSLAKINVLFVHTGGTNQRFSPPYI